MALQQAAADESVQHVMGRTYTLEHDVEVADYAIVYVGAQGRTLTNLMVHFNRYDTAHTGIQWACSLDYYFSFRL